MKHFICLLVTSFLGIAGYSQIDACEDSVLLQVFITNPQPRTGDLIGAYVSVDSRVLKTDIAETLPTESRKYIDLSEYDKQIGIGRFNEKKIGTYEIGSMNFNFNGKKYYTKPFQIQVIEDLPNVPEGLWIRVVKFTESRFCVIIEQRTKVDESANNPNSLSEFSLNKAYLKTVWDNPMKFTVSDAGSSFSSGSVKVDGKDIFYKGSIGYLWIEKVDPNSKYTLEREDFENLPDYYDFKPFEL